MKPTSPSQVSFAQAEYDKKKKRTRREIFLEKMEQVVPWVPYLWPNNVFIVGPKVTHWNYDQFTDGPAYSSVSVK